MSAGRLTEIKSNERASARNQHQHFMIPALTIAAALIGYFVGYYARKLEEKEL